MYVTSLTDNENDMIYVIDTTNNTIIGDPILVEKKPMDIVYNAINNSLYVLNKASKTISIIDTTNNTKLGDPIPAGNNPQKMAYDSANKEIYILNDDPLDQEFKAYIHIVNIVNNTSLNPVPLP